jgi:hypothetical protein
VNDLKNAIQKESETDSKESGSRDVKSDSRIHQFNSERKEQQMTLRLKAQVEHKLLPVVAAAVACLPQKRQGAVTPAVVKP